MQEFQRRFCPGEKLVPRNYHAVERWRLLHYWVLRTKYGLTHGTITDDDKIIRLAKVGITSEGYEVLADGRPGSEALSAIGRNLGKRQGRGRKKGQQQYA
jgi:hypothetical protein